MKRVFTILAFALITVNVFTQPPEKMSYQAVIRNNSNQLVTNQTIRIKISILLGSPSGAVVYSETQTPSTNDNGLITIEIGGGTGFTNIDWANGTYFIQTETDPTGGTNYTITGTSQLLSVPYALYSKSAHTLTGEINESQITDLKGYLTEEEDPLFSAWDKSTDIEISEGQITDLQEYLTQETDPVFVASPVSGITAADVSSWNTAFGWGDHIDNSVTNEIQTLSISGSDLTLSKEGGTVTIPGDNWGNQTAYTDATMSGNGTNGSPLRLASQSASAGQVLKWDGSSWSPGSDLSGSALWSEAGSNIYYNSGRVGIGTSSPATLIHVHGVPVTSRGQLSLSAPSGEGSFLSFYEANEFKAYLWYDVSDDDLRLQNFTAGDLNLNPYGGKVGIGTNTPGYTLDVSGNINFTGTFTQNGSPFAIPWTNLTGTPTTLEGYGITDAVKNTLDINFINKVQKGDMVITTGGLYGKITVVEENFVKIMVEEVLLKVHKKAIRKPSDY